MKNISVISFDEIDPHLDWIEIANAISAGHTGADIKTDDVFLRRDADTLLNRSAWIDGMGALVKAATVFPKQNPAINGGVLVFSDKTGTLDAVLDFHLLTKWKTAADSLLGAMTLARADSKHILILGSGTVATSLISAYRAGFPNAEIAIWNRTASKAATLAATAGAKHFDDLKQAMAWADIITSATMTTEPFIKGEWLHNGQHIDLIGAYRPDMREADDAALKRAEIYVDARSTTVDHIGEIKDPIARGIIDNADVLADFNDLHSGKMARSDDTAITLFKNGGGAHLDLMVARAILEKHRQIFGTE